MQNPIPFKFYNQILFVIAVVFLLLIFLNVFIVNFFFAINLVPSSVIFYSSVFLSIVGCSIISSKYFLVNSKFILFGVLSSCAIFILAKNNSQNFYDVSWDGQAYQLEAIIKMIEGWNPIKTQLDNTIKVENIFINHYPRGTWLNSFSFYQVTENIESGKLFNYLWFVIAWCLSVVVFNHFFKINFFISFFLGLAAAANPVTIYQSSSNYVDGQIAAGILTFILLSIFIFYSNNTGSIILLSIIISLLINYKFSLPFYLVILSVGIILIFLLYKNTEAVKKFIYSSIMGFVFGVGILGFSPYITNILQFQNPIYPLADKSKTEISIGIEEAIQPASFENKNRFERLFQSTFSKSIWSQTPLNNVLKIPGTFSYDEKINYALADGSMAGLGPYFSLALLICLIMLPILYIHNKKIFFSILISISFVLGSVFISRIGWLARYAPQFYLICILVVTALFLIRKWWTFILGCFCLLLLIINDYTIAEIYFPYQKMFTLELNNQLNILQKRTDTTLVCFGPFNSNRLRFKSKNIKFREVNSISELNIDSPKYLPWLFNKVATN